MPAISAQPCHHEYRQAFFIGLGPELCLVPLSFDSFFKIVFIFSSFCFLFFSCSFQNLCYYLPLHFFTSLILSQGVPTSHLSLASLQSFFHFILPPTYNHCISKYQTWVLLGHYMISNRGRFGLPLLSVLSIY